MAQAQGRDLVRLSVAAEHLHVCTRTVRRLIADGRLTGYRLGSRVVLVDLGELDAALRRIPTVERSA